MTESIPKLTIAILTYNRKEYLREVLESLEKQIFKDFEIIIFDNASDYDVYEFSKLFPSLAIKIDANETNIGGIANFRKVIKYDFSSRYVMMFHDDDTMHPEYLAKAIAFLDSHPEAVWVGSNIRFIKHATPEKMKHFKSNVTKHSFKEMGRHELIHMLLSGFGLGFNSVIYRAESLHKAESRDVEFDKWIDRPLMIDLIGNHTVGITEGQFINYRLHGGQDSQLVEPRKLNNVINLFKYYRQQNEGHNPVKYNMLESNNAINTAHHIAASFHEFFSIINVFKKEGMFRVRSIGWKGVYYFFKFILKYIRMRRRD
jgi:glycosyltransferase involved in cell wall biosynthesis